MRNYASTTQAGQTRTRVWRNENENALGEPPRATMHEHLVVRLEDGTEAELRKEGSISMVPSKADFDRVIELRDPETDEVIGKTTLGAVYAAVYSLGRVMQIDRDGQEDVSVKADR